MAMNKAEKEAMESALTAAALRTTSDVFPDVIPPDNTSNRLSTGFITVGSMSDSARVDTACSSSIGHGIGRTDKTTSQGSRRLYSSRILALRALRREVENDCANRLRRIDRMIEGEIKP